MSRSRTRIAAWIAALVGAAVFYFASIALVISGMEADLEMTEAGSGLGEWISLAVGGLAMVLSIPLFILSACPCHHRWGDPTQA